MCEALRRLMKDEIEETLDKATKVENIASAVNASVEQVLGWI